MKLHHYHLYENIQTHSMSAPSSINQSSCLIFMTFWNCPLSLKIRCKWWLLEETTFPYNQLKPVLNETNITEHIKLRLSFSKLPRTLYCDRMSNLHGWLCLNDYSRLIKLILYTLDLPQIMHNFIQTTVII